MENFKQLWSHKGGRACQVADGVDETRAAGATGATQHRHRCGAALRPPRRQTQVVGRIKRRGKPKKPLGKALRGRAVGVGRGRREFIYQSQFEVVGVAESIIIIFQKTKMI